MSIGMNPIGRGQNVEGAGEIESTPAPEAQAPVAGEIQAAPARGGALPGRMAALASVQVSPEYAKEAQLLRAFETAPKAELEKIIAQAKKDDPVAYRSALREFFHRYKGDASRLKLHNMAMDVNNDGGLTFSEAYTSMHDMGFSRLRSFLLSAMTSLLLAPQTTEKFSTVLNVANSDKTERSFFGTGFDDEKKLEKRLDEVMAYDKDNDGFVTLDDMYRMVDDRTSKMDSWLGAKAINYLNKGEWQALFSLMNNRMTRNELKDFYEGSLFFSFLEPDNLAGKLVAYREGKIP